MGYKSESTFNDDEWDKQTREIYLEYARKAMENPERIEEYWDGTDIRKEKDSIRDFEDADDFDLWFQLYYFD